MDKRKKSIILALLIMVLGLMLFGLCLSGLKPVQKDSVSKYLKHSFMGKIQEGKMAVHTLEGVIGAVR